MNLLELVERAGIVGCGGAGFPAHIKWKAKAKDFIINAVECEPLLSTDRYLMRHKAKEIVCACMKVAELIDAENVVIALKRAYEEEIAVLKEEIETSGANIKLHQLDSFYPAGDEQVLVYEVTGKMVPCGGIPLDVGVVVSNVATMIAAFEALNKKPLIEKYITVAGEVRHPAVIKAPLGTSISKCIEAAGGPLIDDYLIVVGGPMMGKEISCETDFNQSVTKTTSGILVLPKGGFMEAYKRDVDLSALKKKARAACIQCSYCTMLCPRHLLGHPLEPHRIMRTIAFADNLDKLFDGNVHIKNASLCSLCGVCTAYACPMGLEPSKVNAFLKDEMARREIRRDEKEDAVPLGDREWRKIPTGRISRRTGVMAYDVKCDELVTVNPEEVVITLRQGPGRLPEPIVDVGDAVAEGTLIASIPEGVIGSNLHASIEGTVMEISDVIRIRR